MQSLPLPPAVRAWLHARGQDDAAIAMFKIGYTERGGHGWITIPVRGPDGEIAFHKLRAAPGNPAPNKYCYEPSGKGAELYGRGLLALPEVIQKKKVVICEGEFDAMLLIKNNIAAVTSTSGVTTFREEWCDLFPPDCHVVLAFDADPAGEKGRAKVRGLFETRRPDCVLSHVRFDDIAQGRTGFDVTDAFGRAREMLQDPVEEFWKLETAEAEGTADGHEDPKISEGEKRSEEDKDTDSGGGSDGGTPPGEAAKGEAGASTGPEDNRKKPFTFLTEKELQERTYQTITTFDEAKLCKYPIEQLNITLQGIFPGETVVVMADSGAGKSDFLRLTAEAVVDSGKKVLFYQLEMDQQENARRKLLRHVNRARAKRTSEGFDSPPLTTIQLAMGKIDEEDREVIMEAIKTTKDGLTTYCGDSLTLIGFLESIRQRIAETGQKPDLICLDHIHYFSREEGMPESESLSAASRQIRAFSRETGVAVLMAAHVRKRKRTEVLTPDDIRGSGSIEKESTTCIALTKKPGMTTVAIWKSRIGADLLKFDQFYDVNFREWSGGAINVMGVEEEDVDATVRELEGGTEKTKRGFHKQEKML